MAERSERGGSRRDDRGGYDDRGYWGGSGDDRDYRGDRGYRGGSGNGHGYQDGERDCSRRVYDGKSHNGLLADLVGHLHALNGRSCAAYRTIVGRYRAPAG